MNTRLNSDESSAAFPAAAPSQHTPALGMVPRRLRLLALVAGLLGFIMFVATPLLPVNQTQSSVSWPQHDSLNSINAPLISVAPESLVAHIPLAATEYLRTDQTMLLGTVPPQSAQATHRGLFVNYSAEVGLTVSSLGKVVLDLSPSEVESARAAAGDGATVDIAATAKGLTVSVADVTEKSEEDLRPQVTGVYTEIDNSSAAQAALPELRVNVEINSRFTSRPTVLKYLAMWLGLAMMVVALVALGRIDRRDGKKFGFMPATWKRIRPLDGVVAGILLFWYVFGANTSDDGFILTMARVSEHAEYMANYYRWYGVPESPFGSPYYDILALLAKLSTASVVVRLPALLAGFCTWFILSREMLPRFGDIVNTRRVAHWTAALMFLAFWLPYNNGTRPEPMVALGVMVTWASFERAIASRRLLPAAIGTIVATVTLAVGPTGLFAVGIFLVSLPHLFRIMAERAKTAGWLPLVAVFLACGTAIMVLVFGDQTLAAVLESTAVRAQVGPALPWYAEFVRYATLFQIAVDGSLTRRFPVFTMLFCLGLIGYAFIKDRRVVGAEPGPTARLLLIVGLSAFFLMFTPTKWTHHFGIYAGVAGVIAALGAVVLSQIALRSTRARTFALAAVAFLLAISLAGWNAWWYVSSFGIPWWDKTIQFHGIQATTVMLAVALLILLVGIIQTLRAELRKENFATVEAFRENERSRVHRWAGLMSAPIAVACAGVVALSMLSFAKAYVNQLPAYSVGKGNLAALAGNRCGMANEVLLEENTNESFLTPVTGTLAKSLNTKKDSGFTPNGVPDAIQPETQKSASVGAISGDANSSSDRLSSSTSNGTSNSTGNGTSTSTSNSTSNGAGTGSSNGTGTANNTADSPEIDASELSSDKSVKEIQATSGERKAKGVNGSKKVLPFNIDYTKIPVLGTFMDSQTGTASLTSQWYELPAATPDAPLLIVSAAGNIMHHDVNGVKHPGMQLTVEYGHRENGVVTDQGEAELADVGATPQWRNLRLPLDKLPPNANVVRLVAVDDSLDLGDWLAVTPPRVPKLTTLNSRYGLETPALLDWAVALQFPCQRTFDHYAGVTEIPKYRILPDSPAQNALTDFQSFSGGGAMSTSDTVNYSFEIPSYLDHDWARDWGSIKLYELRTNSKGQEPDLATIDHQVIARSGWWKNSKMKIRK